MDGLAHLPRPRLEDGFVRREGIDMRCGETTQTGSSGPDPEGCET